MPGPYGNQQIVHTNTGCNIINKTMQTGIPSCVQFTQTAAIFSVRFMNCKSRLKTLNRPRKGRVL